MLAHIPAHTCMHVYTQTHMHARTEGGSFFDMDHPTVTSNRHLLTETLGPGPVPGAISLAAEHRGAQKIEAVVALVGHSGAKAEPVWATGVDLADAVLLVPGICTVDDCN